MCSLFIFLCKSDADVRAFKNVMWSEKTCHMVENIKFELLVIWKFELPSFQNFLHGPSVILVSKVTDVQRLSKIKKNIRIMLLISFYFAVSLCDMWQVFSDHITNDTSLIIIDCLIVWVLPFSHRSQIGHTRCYWFTALATDNVATVIGLRPTCKCSFYI